MDDPIWLCYNLFLKIQKKSIWLYKKLITSSERRSDTKKKWMIQYGYVITFLKKFKKSILFYKNVAHLAST